jgi:hypothetical protein
MINMKTLTLCICSIAVAATAFAQSPAPAQPASPSPAATASVSPATDLADRIHQKIEKKMKGHHGIVIDGDTDETDARALDLGEKMAVPIVAIVFMTIFGAPVLIVAVILYFGFSKNRMMHRTIRMMVEKGQPVPAALLAPPAPAARQRSDMRRGVVLTMVGLGLMIWLGAINDWEGGIWALGIIPFLIGVGYLLVWKLEPKKDISSSPPVP